MSGAESTKKQEYFAKLVNLLETHNKIFVVGVDNVGSNHLQKVRASLRGKAVVLMGKNTMVRKVLRAEAAKNADLEALTALVRGNVGFVFVKDDRPPSVRSSSRRRSEPLPRLESLPPATLPSPPVTPVWSPL